MADSNETAALNCWESEELITVMLVSWGFCSNVSNIAQKTYCNIYSYTTNNVIICFEAMLLLNDENCHYYC